MDCGCQNNAYGALAGRVGDNGNVFEGYGATLQHFGGAHAGDYAGTFFGTTDAELAAWDPYKPGTGVSGGGGRGGQVVADIIGGVLGAYSANRQAAAARSQAEAQITLAQAQAQAQAQAMMFGQRPSEPAPRAGGGAGLQTAAIVGGVVLTVAAIGGLAFALTRKGSGRGSRRAA
jgi:hypothetical protein